MRLTRFSIRNTTAFTCYHVSRRSCLLCFLLDILWLSLKNQLSSPVPEDYCSPNKTRCTVALVSSWVSRQLTEVSDWQRGRNSGACASHVGRLQRSVRRLHCLLVAMVARLRANRTWQRCLQFSFYLLGLYKLYRGPQLAQLGHFPRPTWDQVKMEEENSVRSVNQRECVQKETGCVTYALNCSKVLTAVCHLTRRTVGIKRFITIVATK